MKTYQTAAAAVALLLGLGACADGTPGTVLGSSDTAAVQAFLQKTATARIAGLQKAYNDFAAATPQRTDGMSCVGALPDPTKPADNVGMTNLGSSLLSVWAAVQREIAANPPGTGVTAEEALAKASIYQPGSPQFNWVETQIETGCIAYLHSVNQAVNSTAGMFNSQALGAILAGSPLGM